jgi:UDPglucose 6-dehydrogenase
MKISVIGAGYVGLTCACFADFGHDVVLIDIFKEKVERLNSGILPIHEPGLDDILQRNLQKKRLRATTDYGEVKDSDVVFIAVGTPSREDGSIDLSQIESTCQSLGKQLRETKKFVVVVVKSTVVPGTTKNFVKKILESVSKKIAGKDFGLAMNPEFLREGSAVHDFLNPDKIVLGVFDLRSEKILRELYSWAGQKVPILVTDTNTAEMIKYAQNTALAARVSLMNEIANICEKFNVDVYEVAKAIGLDKRIGPKFLEAGVGFGGSCFRKDIKAFVNLAIQAGIDPIFAKAILEVNERQPYRMIELAKYAIQNLQGKTIAVLGLAFKPNTDDMREARSIPIIQALLQEGAKVKAYDPKAMENAKAIFADKIQYCKSAEECIDAADLIMIVTEWDEFRNLDLKKIKVPIIDGRRAIDPKQAIKLGIQYKGIGWSGNFG